jgi:hypothetical protein
MYRLCERNEVERSNPGCQTSWIASSLTLLAMTSLLQLAPSELLFMNSAAFCRSQNLIPLAWNKQASAYLVALGRLCLGSTP